MTSETATAANSLKLMPDVLARVAPDVSLQKHLHLGLRPCLRKFEEFRHVTVDKTGLGKYETEDKNGNILGSSVVKSGDTIVLCGITGGIVEDEQEAIDDYRLKLEDGIISNEETASSSRKNATVYPVVQIESGRTGPPSEEEMILSQRLHDTLLSSGILNTEDLKISLSLKSRDENGEVSIIGPDQFEAKKSYSFVLYASIQVFSRSGPMFDLCWGSLVAALRNTFLPQVYVDEDQLDIRMPVRSKGGEKATISEEYKLVCDNAKATKLVIDESMISWSSTFGVVTVHSKDGDIDMDSGDVANEDVLLADLEGEVEDTTVDRRIHVVTNGQTLTSVTITGGSEGVPIPRDMIRKAIEQAKRRSNDLVQKL
ncbi:unnamed protein product [Kuraishia capsulata CBS 1993]|uniref:Ribosomal RNA-processing protein 43 n=1 Tax=Kuraishia capsulata CBS 1993 TaxID=1382522 RepID=W6MTN2_9ASCO|nr:uncharacterized protein KUCA_T00001112001 [Kuraishia capsulata CBS 1993]CDK25145.1 unnamed protein product [Kuraishia capsulata CBS 1993]